MTNKQLRRLYQSYNRKWFSGKLPKIVVRFGLIENGALGVTTFIGGEPAYVTISKSIKNWRYVPRMVLLHELCHVRLPVKFDHGPRFQKEMRRLARTGAFDGIW